MQELLLLELERLIIRKKEVLLIENLISNKLEQQQRDENEFAKLMSKRAVALSDIEKLDRKFNNLDEGKLLGLFGLLLSSNIYYYREDGVRYINTLLNLKENQAERRGNR